MIEAERFALGSSGLPLGPSRGGHSGPGRVFGLFVSQPRTVRAEGRLALPFGPLDDFPLDELGPFEAEGGVRRKLAGVEPAWPLPAPEDSAPQTQDARDRAEMAPDWDEPDRVKITLPQDARDRAEIAPALREQVEEHVRRRAETPAPEIVTRMRAAAPEPGTLSAPQARPPRKSDPAPAVPLGAANILHETSEVESALPVRDPPDGPPTREPLRASEYAEPRAPAAPVYVRARHEIPLARARIVHEPRMTERVHTETVTSQAPVRTRIEVTRPPHARFDEMPLDSLPPRRSENSRGKRVYVENLHVKLERPVDAPSAAPAEAPQTQRTESHSRTEPSFEYVNPWLRSAGFLD